MSNLNHKINTPSTSCGRQDQATFPQLLGRSFTTLCSHREDATPSYLNEVYKTSLLHCYRDHLHDPVKKEENFFYSSTFDEAVQTNVLKLRRGPRGGVVKPFPTRLHEMLSCVEDEGLSDVVSWKPHGRCFVIHKPKKFVREVLPRYFNQSKLTSFQRQLNLYAFARFSKGIDRGGYYHELFLRGRPDLCRAMLRQPLKGKGSKQRYQSVTEPDFYGMEYCSGNVAFLVSNKQEENCASRGLAMIANSYGLGKNDISSMYMSKNDLKTSDVLSNPVGTLSKDNDNMRDQSAPIHSVTKMHDDTLTSDSLRNAPRFTIPTLESRKDSSPRPCLPNISNAFDDSSYDDLNNVFMEYGSVDAPFEPSDMRSKKLCFISNSYCTFPSLPNLIMPYLEMNDEKSLLNRKSSVSIDASKDLFHTGPTHRICLKGSSNFLLASQDSSSLHTKYEFEDDISIGDISFGCIENNILEDIDTIFIS